MRSIVKTGAIEPSIPARIEPPVPLLILNYNIHEIR